MRKRQGCYLRFEAANWVGDRRAIGFEQLERRLVLSAAPLSMSHAADVASFESSASVSVIGITYSAVPGQSNFIAPHESIVAAFNAGQSGLPSDVAAPSALSPGPVLSSILGGTTPAIGSSNFSAVLSFSQRSPEIDPFTVTVALKSGETTQTFIQFHQPGELVIFRLIATEDGLTRGDLPPGPFDGAPPDVRPDGPSEFGPGGPGRNYGNAPGGPLPGFGADSLARAQSSASDAARPAMPGAPSAPALPAQITATAGGANDAGAVRGQLAPAEAPQSTAGVLQNPAANLPQISPNLQGSAGTPATGAEQSADVASPETRITKGSSDSQGSAAEAHETALQIEASRAALLASVPLDLAAVDQALATMFNEIERLGGELVTWLDEASAQPWVTAITVAAACGIGGRYMLRRRAGQSSREQDEEASSSWLFTRMHNPAGQS